MPCNIGTGHTVRICCRVRVTQGSSPMPHYIISRHRDFQIQDCFSFVPPSFCNDEQMFFDILQLYECMFVLSMIKSWQFLAASSLLELLLVIINNDLWVTNW